MLDKIFSNETFDILNDDKYYYLFRALNLDDIKDLEDGLITKKNKIIKVRTDGDRYGKKSKYHNKKTITLEEAFDHIKINHRKDTNCISLSTNANVSILYGRGYYKDKYIVVKMKKDDKKIVNAGLFLLEEVEKEIEKYKTKNDLINYYLQSIDNTKSKNKLLEIKNMIIKSKIKFNYTNDTLVYYNDLNNEQNLTKDKIILKLFVLDKNIIKGTSNIELIQAINNAFLSLEYIHYNQITKNEIIEIPEEMMDIISIIQQLDRNEKVELLKKEIVKYIDSNCDKYKYRDYDITNKYLVENMYNSTNGEYTFNDAYQVYKASFYLTKSILRRNNAIKNIKKITKNNTTYNEVYKSLEETLAVEPNIFSKQNEKKLKITDKIELDLLPKEKELVDYILKLDEKELVDIIENPFKNIKNILSNLSYIEKDKINKNDYYNQAIVDIFNMNNSINIKNTKISCLEEYDKYKDILPDKEISNTIINKSLSSTKTNRVNKAYTKKKEI